VPRAAAALGSARALATASTTRADPATARATYQTRAKAPARFRQGLRRRLLAQSALLEWGERLPGDLTCEVSLALSVLPLTYSAALAVASVAALSVTEAEAVGDAQRARAAATGALVGMHVVTATVSVSESRQCCHPCSCAPQVLRP